MPPLDKTGKDKHTRGVYAGSFRGFMGIRPDAPLANVTNHATASPSSPDCVVRDRVAIFSSSLADAADGHASARPFSPVSLDAGKRSNVRPSSPGQRIANNAETRTSAPSRPVVGRFAPTPSGRMHLGNVASCLVAWLSARSAGGRMVLRIEDLDPRAQSREAARLIMDDLRWLGLDWDEGPYYQSERGELYAAAIARLGDGPATGLHLTYPCFCTRSELHAASAPHASDGTYVYAGTCRGLSPEEVTRRSAVRPPATRLRVPDANDPTGAICFRDLAYGPQREVLATECGDFLVRRSDGVVAYQLAVVVDDGEMGVTQVVRGHDLLGSCARQIYLQRLLGYAEPAYGHVPLLVAPDGRRLSKREHDLDLGALRERYAGPEPLLGAIASRLGLAEPGEPVSADTLAARFSWDVVAAHRADIVVDESFLP